jgi:hypothetical protein
MSSTGERGAEEGHEEEEEACAAGRPGAAA